MNCLSPPAGPPLVAGCGLLDGRRFHAACRHALIAVALLLTVHRPGYCQGNAPGHATARTDEVALSMLEAQRTVDLASRHGAPWSGPETGAPAQPGKTIAFVAEDLRNGGIVGVAQGVREAAAVIGWSLKIFDAGGSVAGRAKALHDALASHVDGLILCGSDALENTRLLQPFANAGLPIVGWHTGPRPGPIPSAFVATNITTDPLEVARVTALAAIVASHGHAGVVIFTDSRFAIAMAKAKVMAQTIGACAGCSLLEVQDVAISDSAAKMPALTHELLARYDTRFTHALAINDIYFDDAIPALTKAGRSAGSLSLLSAGDGSAPALLRIQARTFQTATVAEPLRLHGWQTVDELNRLLAHDSVSGFVAPVHLVTFDNIAFDGGKSFQYDPDNGYRTVYRRIWKR
jgi:ribose transport system substrate-binding protein